MKLNYIGKEVHGYNPSYDLDFIKFITWLDNQKIVGFDIETNVVPSILDRELRTLQFSNREEVYVIQYSWLDENQRVLLFSKLNEPHRKLIIHSVTFEYSTLLKYGVVLKNVFCTYRAEQILNTGKGAEQGMFDLESTIFRRFGISLNKEYQMTFGDDIMTKEKIGYAGMDVAKSVHLREIQLDEMKQFDKSFPQHHHKGLVKTNWWENEFSFVVGDMEQQGFLIDTDKWIKCYEKSLPLMQEAKKKLDAIVVEEFKGFAIGQGWLSDKDRFEPIWGSSQKKKEILQLVFPNIESVTKLGLKEYLRDNDPDFPMVEEVYKATGLLEKRKLKITGKEWEDNFYIQQIVDKFGILKLLIKCPEGLDFEGILNRFFYQNFPEFMLNHGYVIPANQLSLNWASPQQKLILFQHLNPKIDSTNALTVENNLLTHPLFKIYEEYQDASALVTKFGLDYLKHVQQDGRIRTSFNTVLATGRLSAREPNLLQLPRNQDYRSCFIAPEGFKIVDADWDMQEIVILATLAKERLWLEALAKGEDIHSMDSKLIYENIWDNATEETCEYVLHKKKCHCKGHKPLRTKSKNLSFGLSYGLGAYGFAARNHVTEEEAVRLINKFFTTFCNIKEFLTKCGNFAVTKKSADGYSFINENGTGRIRFFDKWKTAKQQDWYGNWVYKNAEEVAGVRRAGANFVIQALGASLLKVACVLLRRWILNNNLRDHIQIALPYHDQIILYARNSNGYPELAKEKLEHYMKSAGKLLLKHNLLRATANISDYWIKD
jgi:DNA polymerase I-like protein with 3'-5' exonuclease and polymerase domains